MKTQKIKTIEQTYDGYIYKGVHIIKRYYAKEVIWITDGRVFPTLKEAKRYIDKKKRKVTNNEF